MTRDPEAVAELGELTAAVRAHVEWLVESGASGVPRAERTTPVAAGTSAGVAVPPDDGGGPRPIAAAPPPAAPARVTSRQVAGPPSVSTAVAVPATKPLPGSAAHAATAEPRTPVPAPRTPPLDPEEKKRRLDVLAETVRGCTRCALHSGRTQTVFARGTGAVGLCFVGEGPGADEDAQGFPFVGKAGQLLDKMIEAMGFSRDDVYVCNIVKCRPPENRKPEPEEMAACMPYLKEQLELLAPEVIVALGATAVQGLFGTSEGITRLRGRWKLYGGRVPVMPTFHPAYLLRTPSAKREVWEDLQAVLRQMGRVAPARK